MDNAVYEVEARIEATHWWFVGRRALFTREIGRLGLDLHARVVDVGTGTGAGLRMLRDLRFTDVQGIDANEIAIRYCALKNLGQVQKGDICALPFPDASKDLICATDILEHVDDDTLALSEITRVLAKHGFLLLTVPTFSILWGLQDEVAHHKRRYSLRTLLHRIKSANLTPIRYYYFNYLLFVPILAARRIIRWTGANLRTENDINTPTINNILVPLFKFDCITAPYLHPPFGVSALVIASKL